MVDDTSSLRPSTLTWAGLLGQWIEFAQASIALPNDASGKSWKASVPHVINLQAVTFALAEIQELTDDEQGLACDKAAIIIDGAAGELQLAWEDGGLPDSLSEMVSDARVALDVAQRTAGESSTDIEHR